MHIEEQVGYQTSQRQSSGVDLVGCIDSVCQALPYFRADGEARVALAELAASAIELRCAALRYMHDDAATTVEVERLTHQAVKALDTMLTSNPPADSLGRSVNAAVLVRTNLDAIINRIATASTAPEQTAKRSVRLQEKATA